VAKFKPSGKSLRTFKPKARITPKGLHRMRVDSQASDGRGIAKIDSKTVFITGALEGEEVQVHYTNSHKKFDSAQTHSVIHASNLRVEPICEYFSRCGGCSLQHLSYPGQLEFKQKSLSHDFSSLLDKNCDWTAPITSSPLAYRHRARFSVVANRDRCDVGFRQQGSHEIVDIDHCHIVYPKISTLIGPVKVLIKSLKKRSVISEVSITEDDNSKLGIIINCKHRLNREDLDRCMDFSQHHSVAVELAETINTDQCFYWSSGASDFSYTVNPDNISIPFALKDFTQVNPAINQQMINMAINWLELAPGDKVADFFCGIGNFTLPIAGLVKSVLGYELVTDMVSNAENNARINSIKNCSFKKIDLMAEKIMIKDEFNKVLLDPPRAGAESLCRQLAVSLPTKIVYVSCNPNTLFRDAKILLAAGYSIESIVLADMFPQTAHCELISLFILPVQ
jgi:23S rRNA (uracil1939-C5)-methyltransferase